MRASARARSTPSPKRSSRRCAPALAATRSRRNPVNEQGQYFVTKDPQPQRKPENCAFIIFGVTGDLTHRLVLPALYHLAAENLLPAQFCVVGAARKPMSNDELRDSLMKGLREHATRPVDDATAKQLLQCVTCVEADSKEPASFDALRKHLDGLECSRGIGGNYLFYMATPPAAFAPTARERGRAGLLK